VAEFDAYKRSAIPLIADAHLTLEELSVALHGYHVSADYTSLIAGLKQTWEEEVDRLYHLNNQPLPAQSELIGAIWEAAGPRDVILSAAGSHPGDLHKLWRAHTPNSYHLEYGYSTMGYEIPGAIGAKLADPSREVFVWVGDGTYLMMPTEIVTAVQEHVKLVIVVVDNHGFGSIGGLSESLGSQGFGTRFRYRTDSGQLDGEPLPIDYAANARSLGAIAIKANGLEEFKQALQEARKQDRVTVVVVEADREVRVPGYESWWDVAAAEVSESDLVRQARAEYEEAVKKEKYYL
jgi:3D-(3,5/4)-trihydroxycyclohexane-1,2-dione acylhydrolase (decyclizing)